MAKKQARQPQGGTVKKRKREDYSDNDTVIRAPTMGPAAQKVVGTCELLEMIMTYLPSKDVRTAEKVARNWRKIATTSLPIRRARCVHPTPLPHAGMPIFMDWPAKADPVFRAMVAHHMVNRTISYANSNLIVHPFLVHFALPTADATDWSIYSIDSLVKLRGSGNLRQQYITEPPIPIVYLQIAKVGRSGPMESTRYVTEWMRYVTECSIRVSTGVTLADVVEARDDLAKYVEGGMEDSIGEKACCFVRFAARPSGLTLKQVISLDRKKVLEDFHGRLRAL